MLQVASNGGLACVCPFDHKEKAKTYHHDCIIHVYTIRSKIQDLNGEIAQMTQEIETYNQESATYLTFEKRLVRGLHVHCCVCTCIFVGGCLATKFFWAICQLWDPGSGWVIIK